MQMYRKYPSETGYKRTGNTIKFTRPSGEHMTSKTNEKENVNGQLMRNLEIL